MQSTHTHVPSKCSPGGAPPEALKALCNDPVSVVKAAARDHWAALGGRLLWGPGLGRVLVWMLVNLKGVCVVSKNNIL